MQHQANGWPEVKAEELGSEESLRIAQLVSGMIVTDASEDAGRSITERLVSCD